jgi:hypothetical protein
MSQQVNDPKEKEATNEGTLASTIAELKADLFVWQDTYRRPSEHQLSRSVNTSTTLKNGLAVLELPRPFPRFT